MPVSQNHQLKQLIGHVVRNAVQVSLTPINALLTMCVRTDKTRWRKVATQVPPWDERNRGIASFIPDNTSVLDLGSGAMTLKQYLKPACQYQPCDVVQSSPEVILCDFNAQAYPRLAKQYDYVVCSGILEYMREPLNFLSRIQEYGTVILLSYNPAVPGETSLSRLAKGWVNNFTQGELESLFAKLRLRFQILLRREPNEITFKLTKSALL